MGEERGIKVGGWANGMEECRSRESPPAETHRNSDARVRRSDGHNAGEGEHRCSLWDERTRPRGQRHQHRGVLDMGGATRRCRYQGGNIGPRKAGWIIAAWLVRASHTIGVCIRTRLRYSVLNMGIENDAYASTSGAIGHCKVL